METKHTDGKRFLFPPIVPPKLDVTPMQYPKEAIEHLVDQIIKIHERSEFITYSHQIDSTMSILNNMLELFTKPILTMKDGN